jgi:hypothetical protein
MDAIAHAYPMIPMVPKIGSEASDA